MRDLNDSSTQHMFEPLELASGSARAAFARLAIDGQVERSRLADGRLIEHGYADFDARR